MDLWHVREPASVAEYRTRARAEVDRLRAAGVVPLLVGGSGLYVRAVLDELEFPGTDPALRARLLTELDAVHQAEAEKFLNEIEAKLARPGVKISREILMGGGAAELLAEVASAPSV